MDDFSETYKYWYPKGHLMNVEVTGHRSKKFKNFIARAVEYYATLLLPKRKVPYLSVDITFKNKLDDDSDGFCYDQGKDGRYHDFEIEVAKGKSVRETLMTIAHEMVHIKQFCMGELKDGLVPATTSVWKGKIINEKSTDYWDLPWEIEAFGREKGMYHRFVVQEKLDKNKDFLSQIVS
jgi:hypothetical protein